MSRIAIESYLIDEVPLVVPPGFAVLRVGFAEGVPRELVLADGWSVIVQVPTGVARTWLDGDPTDLVASDQLERVPHSSALVVDEIARAAPRIVVRRNGSLLGALALSSGVVSSFSAQSALLELIPLRWEIRAGAMRGRVPNSAKIELAWRSRVMASATGPG